MVSMHVYYCMCVNYYTGFCLTERQASAIVSEAHL